MSKTIYILNGPNLNLLGTREPGIYGSDTLADIEKRSRNTAMELGYRLEFRQSNQEGELVDWIQEAAQKGCGIIINAAAYTHTSVAIRDAIKAGSLPCIEVHISNIFKRSEFRHHSFISDVSTGIICGLGTRGYELAVMALVDKIETGS